MSSPPSKSFRVLALIWASAAVIMAGVVVWAAMQVNDPLEDYIRTDKVRHILAFGAIGLCSGLMPSTKLRVIGLGLVLTLAVAIELIQIPIPSRTASVADLFASSVGAFGGFGLAAAAVSLLELVRRKSQHPSS